MIEVHTPGTVTFTVTASAISKFRVDDEIDIEVEGRRVTGKVAKAERGNAVGIIVVKLPGQPSV